MSITPESIPTKRVTGARVEDRWTRRDGTPSARHGQGMRYLARYVGTDGREHTKSFRDKAKKQAEAWLRDQSAAVSRGEWIDPSKSAVTVSEVAETWLAGNKAKTAATAASYANVWTKHVKPRWGHVPLAQVDHDEIVMWVGGLTDGTVETSDRKLSASAVRHAHAVLHQILALAVRSKRLRSNPASDVPLPAMAPTEKVFLDPAEIERLGRAADYLTATVRSRIAAGKASATPAEWSAVEVPMSPNGLALRVLGLCGLRFGELSGLRVSRVDLDRRRLVIDTAVSEVSGRIVIGAPKNRKSREVPVPAALVAPLRAQIADREPGDYVFTTATGGPLRRGNFSKRVFAPARDLAEIDGDATLHSLRHSFASITLTSGVPPKQVQEWMGHHSLKLTADVYGHLFASETDRALALLDRAIGGNGSAE
ncbi:tyrosine-type recombinase/integrase [Gordonia jacobaea]|uniref:tyrosine-type recombinase/integrase n=1 Tax=Gordonia jacobaea TaxID=122202 RepID=UPI0022E5BF2E|nr:site-specific integrase [Gordonia jacobaea]